jgi:hypothetical protein
LRKIPDLQRDIPNRKKPVVDAEERPNSAPSADAVRRIRFPVTGMAEGNSPEAMKTLLYKEWRADI